MMGGRMLESAKADMTHAKALAPSAEYVSKNLLAMQTTSEQDRASRRPQRCAETGLEVGR